MDERSEYGTAGMPRDPARDMRRAGLAEAAGLTGGYVEPSKSFVASDPAEDDYEWERREAERDARRHALSRADGIVVLSVDSPV